MFFSNKLLIHSNNYGPIFFSGPTERGQIQRLPPTTSKNASRRAIDARNNLLQFIMSEGRLEFQERYALKRSGPPPEREEDSDEY